MNINAQYRVFHLYELHKGPDFLINHNHCINICAKYATLLLKVLLEIDQHYLVYRSTLSPHLNSIRKKCFFAL